MAFESDFGTESGHAIPVEHVPYTFTPLPCVMRPEEEACVTRGYSIDLTYKADLPPGVSRKSHLLWAKNLTLYFPAYYNTTPGEKITDFFSLVVGDLDVTRDLAWRTIGQARSIHRTAQLVCEDYIPIGGPLRIDVKPRGLYGGALIWASYQPFCVDGKGYGGLDFPMRQPYNYAPNYWHAKKAVRFVNDEATGFSVRVEGEYSVQPLYSTAVAEATREAAEKE